jgi:hypothetical protein
MIYKRMSSLQDGPVKHSIMIMSRVFSQGSLLSGLL